MPPLPPCLLTPSRLFVYSRSLAADVNARNNKGKTPLHLAASLGRAGIASLLLTAGAEVDAQDNKGNTPLYLAASLGRVGMISLLLTAGADIGLADEAGNATPLHRAVVGGYYTAASLLISAGAEVDAQNAKGRTPLHLAASLGRVGIISLLLSVGADGDLADEDGNATPLHRAVVGGYYTAASLLIDAVTEVDAQNKKGRTPLYLAASLGRTGIVSLLLSVGADGGLADEDGITPLDKAVENDLDVVADIRDAGGVCLTRTDEECGLIMRPLHFTVVVAENHFGAAHAVTAITHGDASPVYSLLHDVDGFSFDSGKLTVNQGVLTEGMVVTISIQAAAGAQSVTVERVVSVSAAAAAWAGGVLSNYPSLLTASSEYMGVLATLSATEEDVAVSYDSGLDEKVFTLTALPSGKAELSLVARLGAEDAVATAVVELSKYGHAPTLVTARVTVEALLPAKTVITAFSSTVSLSLSARHGGMKYEKISGPAELSVSDSGEISATSPLPSNYHWHHLEVRADSPGILGGERFSVSLLAAHCAPGDLPTSGAPANLIGAINKKIGIDDICRMINAGHNVNFRNSANATPLHRAVIRDYPAAATLLVNAGANVDAQDSGGETPLYLAIENQKGNMARLLLKAGADVNLPNTDGYTALDIAVDRFEPVGVGVETFVDPVGGGRHWWYDRVEYDLLTLVRHDSNGVCLVLTSPQCGIIARPARSTAPVFVNYSGANYSGAVHTVTATVYYGSYDRSGYSPIYSLVDSVGGLSLTVSEAGVLSLSANSGVLTSGFVATISIQARTDARSYAENQRHAQSVTVEVVIEVSVPPTLSSYPALLTASSEYMGVLATLSATEEDVAMSYDSGLDEKVFTLTALPSGKAELSLVARLGAEDAVATAVVELSKYGHAPTLVTARVTVEALLPAKTVITAFSSTVSLSLSARHGGMKYEKISGPAELSVSDSGEISATSPLPSNYHWHHLEVRADSPGILGGERFSVSLLAAHCAPGDLPTSGAPANLIGAINKKIGIDDICRMINAGHNVNFRNSANATPLHRAVIRDYPAAATLLVNAGANVDAQDSGGETPLYLAIENQKGNMARLLLKAGADVNLPNTDGYTALDIAVDRFEPVGVGVETFVDPVGGGRHWWYDRVEYDLLTLVRHDSNGVCLVLTSPQCGIIARPARSTAPVFVNYSGANYSGAVHTVTATVYYGSYDRSGYSPIYSLVDSVGGLSLTVSEAGVLSLSANSGVLTSGFVATISIQARTDARSYAENQRHAQSVTVEVVIEVSVPPTLSSYPALLTASSEYMGVLATLSATEEDVAMSYDSGLDEKVFTLTALPSGKAELSLVARLGAEDAVATAVVELSKYGHAPTLVTARVTVEALLPAKTVITAFSSTVSLSLSARHGGMKYEKISGPAELSVSDSGEISATSPLPSNYHWHHLEVRADSPGILGGERFSVSLLAAHCAPGDSPTSGAPANLIGAINKKIGIDDICRMINAGHNVNFRNSANATPLHRAVIRDYPAAATLLVNAGANVDAQNNGGKTPLYLAIENQKENMARLLLKAGADVNLPNADGYTALNIAVIRDYPAAATLLVNAGANVDAQGSGGKTPLYFAIENQKENMARLLLKAGADVNLPNTDGYTALDIAVGQFELGVAVETLARSVDGALHWWYDRVEYDILTLVRHDSNGVCLVLTSEQCGIIARPARSTVTIGVNYSGAVHTVTATVFYGSYDRSGYSPIYSLVDSVGGLSLTVSEAGVLSLSANSGVLTSGFVATISIQARTDARSYAENQRHAQSVTVEVVIEVSAAAAAGNAGLFHPPDMFQNPPLQLISPAQNQFKPPKLARAHPPKIPKSPATLGAPPLPPPSRFRVS